MAPSSFLQELTLLASDTRRGKICVRLLEQQMSVRILDVLTKYLQQEGLTLYPNPI